MLLCLVLSLENLHLGLARKPELDLQLQPTARDPT